MVAGNKAVTSDLCITWCLQSINNSVVLIVIGLFSLKWLSIRIVIRFLFESWLNTWSVTLLLSSLLTPHVRVARFRSFRDHQTLCRLEMQVAAADAWSLCSHHVLSEYASEASLSFAAWRIQILTVWQEIRRTCPGFIIHTQGWPKYSHSVQKWKYKSLRIKKNKIKQNR